MGIFDTGGGGSGGAFFRNVTDPGGLWWPGEGGGIEGQ